MADVQIVCASCGNSVTVSQFADPAAITCAQCGQKLQGTPSPVGAADASRTTPRPKLKERESLAAATLPQSVSSEPQQWDVLESMKKDMPPPPGVSLIHTIGSWATFALVGAVAGCANYLFLPGFFTPWAHWIVLIFVITILLKAFKDSMFQGMLCLFVPGYAFYYLFLVCDDFYLRAVIGGLMVGVGEQAYYHYSDLAIRVFIGITKWIQSGGG